METRLSSKGQVVLPGPLRRKLGLRPGDPLRVTVSEGRIVLTPKAMRLRAAKVTADPLTGLPVLTAGPQAPVLTSRQVEEILAETP
jgi:AbrB family looped-hinge helix DNA binding protein